MHFLAEEHYSIYAYISYTRVWVLTQIKETEVNLTEHILYSQERDLSNSSYWALMTENLSSCLNIFTFLKINIYSNHVCCKLKLFPATVQYEYLVHLSKHCFLAIQIYTVTNYDNYI